MSQYREVTDFEDDLAAIITPLLEEAYATWGLKGGTSQDLVREHLLPRLARAGLVIMQRPEPDQSKPIGRDNR